MPVNELILGDLRSKYSSAPVDARYTRLYPNDPELGLMFAYFHGALNSLLGFLYEKKDLNGHFNANESRELLALMKEFRENTAALRRISIRISVDARYGRALNACRAFLQPSGGSVIPDDFPVFELENYEPIFHRGDSVVLLSGSARRYDLQLVGEGSYAIVHKYFDEDYGFWVALKRARRSLDDKELERFRGEYELLKRIRFPYIVEAYAFNESNHSYTMEYCDQTLLKYVTANNQKIGLATRKRIALQFLYGMNHLHSKQILHRDLSYTNVLVKEYDSAVLVKLSDFGLHKARDSDLTATHSEMKGTLIDPLLVSFKSYGTSNEIYAVGRILNFIFTGRRELDGRPSPVRDVVNRCVSLAEKERYSGVLQVIEDIEGLRVSRGDLARSGTA